MQDRVEGGGGALRYQDRDAGAMPTSGNWAGGAHLFFGRAWTLQGLLMHLVGRKIAAANI